MIAAPVEDQLAHKSRPVIGLNDPDPRPRAGCGPVAIVVGIVVLAGLGVAAYFLVTHLMGGGNSATAPGGRGGPRGDIPVKVAVAHKGEMNVYLQGLGSVTPLNNVTVRTRVDGQIMKVAFVEGQFVKEGQLLIEIDPRPYQVQLAQAQGQLLKDQSQQQEAQLDLQRYQSIPNSVTQQQIDQQKALVQQFAGAVISDQSAVDNARLNLTYCQIGSPITGRIGLRSVDVGNIVHASDQMGMAVVAQIQPITVVFTVAEDQITEVFRRPDHGEGLPVDAYSQDLTRKLATGKLLAIDNQVDPATGTVRIKALFDNTDYGLFPGQFVNAKLLVNTLKDVVIAPRAAVQLGPQSSFVYVVNQATKTVDLRNVTEGPREGDQEVIEEGVQPGDLVVTDGVDKLVQGTKISIATSGKKGPGAATQPAGGKGKGMKGGHGGAATSGPATRPNTATPEAEAR
ncbi:MAG TPA: efflux RND transporter periplasmic adaptor subunit [Tepidisphaeraceae bacterium]|nr:efflux RND transporter periplasmic adaptor subunit [Tepidisphaeraceae bacterium]